MDAQTTLASLLRQMSTLEASDLFLTTGAPPHIKVDGVTYTLELPPLAPGETAALAACAMTPAQQAEFDRLLEANLAWTTPDAGRFRINVYRQRGETALVVRRIQTRLPSFEALRLPPAAAELALLPRGLVLVVGAAGAGKSTTLAAMVDHRARHTSGHILTVEDPIEYLFTHDRCTVDQREVGVDTLSFADALRNAMRQAPDMIMIGEVRDRLTMEQAIAYAETGHLCVTTLHAASASQAIKRIVNFFPEAMQAQVRLDLALNLQGVLSQRLLPGRHGGRVLATEVLLASALVADIVQRGAVEELRHAVEKNSVAGMHTFDQSLLALVRAGELEPEVALAHADSHADLSVRMKVHSAYDPL
jgi:twitching motility protein PilU